MILFFLHTFFLAEAVIERTVLHFFAKIYVRIIQIKYISTIEVMFKAMAAHVVWCVLVNTAQRFEDHHSVCIRPDELNQQFLGNRRYSISHCNTNAAYFV